MSRILLTEAAQADLQEIKDYIASDNVAAARMVILELKAAMHSLAEMPGKGHTRKDLTRENVLFWPVYSYLVVYHPKTDPLQVVAVISGRRDAGPLLAKRVKQE